MPPPLGDDINIMGLKDELMDENSSGERVNGGGGRTSGDWDINMYDDSNYSPTGKVLIIHIIF